MRAVDSVTFNVLGGETLGVVGESGSGKSTLARLLVGLMQPTSGSIRFRGRDMTNERPDAMRAFRKSVQIVFQDPHGSLNRRKTVEQIIGAPLLANGVRDRNTIRSRVDEVLEYVGLNPQIKNSSPGRISGGQCQRVSIARALILRPDVVILDEAVSALDVSVRGQILNLLRSLQRDMKLTYVFISHDLAVVRYMSDRVMVMLEGKIVEVGEGEAFFHDPKHPYTRSLIDALPSRTRLSEPSQLVLNIERPYGTNQAEGV